MTKANIEILVELFYGNRKWPRNHTNMYLNTIMGIIYTIYINRRNISLEKKDLISIKNFR